MSHQKKKMMMMMRFCRWIYQSMPEAATRNSDAEKRRCSRTHTCDHTGLGWHPQGVVGKGVVGVMRRRRRRMRTEEKKQQQGRQLLV